MATATAGIKSITVEVVNPLRDDLIAVKIWRSTVAGFTPSNANLVYDGPDFTVVLTGLPPNVQQYLRTAIYSQIDPADYELSDELTATPTGVVVNAEDVFPGTIRGSNVFAGSFGTKGSTLSTSNTAGAVTLNVVNTADFPASGSAVIGSATSARDSDYITYTGKTATTLTGVAGATAHSAGEAIIPMIKAMVIDGNANEMRFLGDRGDGTIEMLASIGIRPGATADGVIGQFGTLASTREAIYAQGKYGAIRAHSEEGIAVNATSNGATAVVSGNNSGTGVGVIGQGTFGQGGIFSSSESTALRLNTGGARGHIEFFGLDALPAVADARDGDFAYLGVWSNKPGAYFFDGIDNAWKKVMYETTTLQMGNGSAAAPSFSFINSPAMGMWRRTASSLGFAVDGIETMWLDADGLRVPTAPITDNTTKAASTAHVKAKFTEYGLGDLLTNPLPIDNINNDTVNPSGFYNITTATTGAAPLASGMAAGVVAHFLTGNTGMQLYVGASSGRMATRSRVSGAWNAWVEWLDENDMVAILAQCGLLGGTNNWTGSNSFEDPVSLTAGYVSADVNWDHQTAHAAITAPGTATAAQILGRKIRYTGATGTVTLDTPANIDAQHGLGHVNKEFVFTIMNTGPGTLTVALPAGITSFGSLVMPTGTSGTFSLRRSAAATYVLYRW